MKNPGSKIIIMRHGQALNNVNHFYSTNPNHPNYIEAPLTDYGKQEVENSAKELLKLNINKNNVIKLFVSPLPRTKETAQILIKTGVASANVELIENIITERQAGDREGQDAKIDDMEKNNDHANAHSYNGETDQAVYDRVLPLYSEIINRIPFEAQPYSHSNGFDPAFAKASAGRLAFSPEQSRRVTTSARPELCRGIRAVSEEGYSTFTGNIIIVTHETTAKELIKLFTGKRIILNNAQFVIVDL